MAVAALQILDVDGDGLVLGAVQYQVGQQIVVPYPHDFQHAHGDEDGLHDGQHYAEERADGPAAVDGRSLLHGQRHALDKAAEHEHRQPRAKAQIHHGDAPGGIQLQRVGRARQGEHDHLEGYHHGEHAQVVHHLGGDIIHAGDVPRRHGGAQQDQHGRQDGDHKAVARRIQEGIRAGGEAVYIVAPAHKGFLVGQGEHV